MQISQSINQSPRIIFMGTPEFAVASLNALVHAKFNVVAVVTAPDKPGGRGMHLQQSAVKQYALEQAIPVLQPEKLKNPAFLETLSSFKADLQVVVAFRMLPEVVWNMPPMGTINVHGSLLPNYRGAAPINWAIINGETSTGVTTFKLKHEIDTGDMLMQATLPIGPNETAGEIHDKMMNLGAETLVKTINAIIDNTIIPQPQQLLPGEQKHAPKIFTETCLIDPSKKAQELHNLIRGLSPFPGAFLHLDDKILKVYKSSLINIDSILPKAGSWYTNGKNLLALGCANGWIQLHEVQLAGKKRMVVEDFLRGYKWPATVDLVTLP